MRTIVKVTFMVDAVSPLPVLNSVIVAGAAAREYSIEQYTVSQKVDNYVKLKKE